MASVQLISNQGDFSEVDWAAIGPLRPCLPFFEGARVVPSKEYYGASRHDEHVRMVNGVMKPQVGVVVRPPREFLKHWAATIAWDIYHKDLVLASYFVPSKSIVVRWADDSKYYSYRAGDEVRDRPDVHPVFETAMLVTLQDVQNTPGIYSPEGWAERAQSITREFFDCVDEVVQELFDTIPPLHVAAVMETFLTDVMTFKKLEWAEVNTILDGPVFSLMVNFIRNVSVENTCWIPPPGQVCVWGLPNGLIATRHLQIVNSPVPSTPPSAVSSPVTAMNLDEVGNIIVPGSPMSADNEPDE
jgi:hypothetical protein